MNYYKTNEDCFLQPYIALYFTSSIKILYYAKLAIICGDDPLVAPRWNMHLRRSCFAPVVV